MRLIDTHCHLQDKKFDKDREAVLERALEALDALVVIGDDLPSSRAAVGLVRDRVHAAVGVHPYYAESLDEETLDALRKLAAEPGVAAMGEIGLDYYNEYAAREAQHRAFHAQLALARALELPAVIHNREADEDAIAILSEYAAQLPGVIMHCFGSSPAMAERCVELGCHLSFAGNVTFPKARALRDAASVVPLERLLVETDAPYLAPPPKRGRRCEPQYVEYTARVLAGVKGVPFDALAEQTTANARAVYRLTLGSR